MDGKKASPGKYELILLHSFLSAAHCGSGGKNKLWGIQVVYDKIKEKSVRA